MPRAETPRHPALLPAGWPAPPRVHAFTTLRHGAGASHAPFDTFNLGNRYAADGDDAAVVARNRATLLTLAGLPGEPAWLKQVHGTRVVRVAEAQGDDATPHDGGQVEPEADASVTETPGRVLAILTADCLPVVFAARSGEDIGAAHAGWRGLADGVLERTLDAMRTAPGDLVAWIGPAAGPARYEIGEDVHAAFVDASAAAESAFVPTRPGHWRVDLPMLARQRLVAAGMRATDIHGGDHCTIDDPRFFSHRRDRRTGRMATVVWRDP